MGNCVPVPLAPPLVSAAAAADTALMDPEDATMSMEDVILLTVDAIAALSQAMKRKFLIGLYSTVA